MLWSWPSTSRRQQERWKWGRDRQKKERTGLYVNTRWWVAVSAIGRKKMIGRRLAGSSLEGGRRRTRTTTQVNERRLLTPTALACRRSRYVYTERFVCVRMYAHLTTGPNWLCLVLITFRHHRIQRPYVGVMTLLRAEETSCRDISSTCKENRSNCPA